MLIMSKPSINYYCVDGRRVTLIQLLVTTEDHFNIEHEGFNTIEGILFTKIDLKF